MKHHIACFIFDHWWRKFGKIKKKLTPKDIATICKCSQMWNIYYIILFIPHFFFSFFFCSYEFGTFERLYDKISRFQEHSLDAETIFNKWKYFMVCLNGMMTILVGNMWFTHNAHDCHFNTSEYLHLCVGSCGICNKFVKIRGESE